MFRFIHFSPELVGSFYEDLFGVTETDRTQGGGEREVEVEEWFMPRKVIQEFLKAINYTYISVKDSPAQKRVCLSSGIFKKKCLLIIIISTKANEQERKKPSNIGLIYL